MQIADTGKFVLLFIVFASIVLAVFYIRTPRHMRKNDDFFIMLLSVAALSFSMFYGIILLISSPAEHYPAVVIERSESDSDEEHTLTILLDDGTEAELNVSEQAYYLEKTGTKFVVCQKNNVFGIRIVRLHLPENNSSQTDNTST